MALIVDNMPLIQDSLHRWPHAPHTFPQIWTIHVLFAPSFRVIFSGLHLTTEIDGVAKLHLNPLSLTKPTDGSFKLILCDEVTAVENGGRVEKKPVEGVGNGCYAYTHQSDGVVGVWRNMLIVWQGRFWPVWHIDVYAVHTCMFAQITRFLSINLNWGQI